MGSLKNPCVVQHSYNGLVYQPSKLGVRVRFPYAAQNGPVAQLVRATDS